MTVQLYRVRKFAAILFEVIALSVTLVYCTTSAYAEKVTPTSNLNIRYADYDNPILFLKTTDSHTLTAPLSKIQLFAKSFNCIHFDSPGLEILTNDALRVSTGLYHVFYVFVSINAP